MEDYQDHIETHLGQLVKEYVAVKGFHPSEQRLLALREQAILMAAISTGTTL